MELLPWPACSPDLSPIENTRSVFAIRLARYTPPAPTLDQLWQYMEAGWTDVPQGYIQSLFDSTPRLVAAVIANNGGYTNYSFCHHSHITKGYNFNRLIIVQHVIYQINLAVISGVLLGGAFCVASSVQYSLFERKVIIEIIINERLILVMEIH
ncbi:uncharacterized protein TNCV_4842081 [Trichonephila clavipes]|uniref:Uncharacterized protein n=1 Tax=Trichonephila clavipes TaxID=2585209 RepID=A0A8X6WJU6_TRICX|nr:uncharacterized protein TNCV_4842081 [Trichonephila clavipes]